MPFVWGLENPTEASWNIIRWLVKHNYSEEDIGKGHRRQRHPGAAGSLGLTVLLNEEQNCMEFQLKKGYRPYGAYQYLEPGRDFKVIDWADWDWAGQETSP